MDNGEDLDLDAEDEKAKKSPSKTEYKPIIKFQDRFDVTSTKQKDKEKKKKKKGENTEVKPWKIIS